MATGMATAKPAALSKAALGRAIDALGKLRADLTDLKAAERELSEQVETAMQAARLAAADGKAFSAALAESRRLEIDVARFSAVAGRRVFLECARIDAKAARRHFEQADLERLSEVKTSISLRISRRPGKG